MPGSIPSMAVKKKQSIIPPSQGPLSTSTIESQRVGNRSEGENGFHLKPSPQTKKTCSANKSIQICYTTSWVSAAGNGLNVDERLKAARERREEQQKLLVSRELSRLEREQRARRYHEQQLQERRKKLLEQRLKEERRRAAVEEKRKQRLKEDKERYEGAVRRTIERSQKAQQHISQSSRGRKSTKNAPRRLPLTTWERNLVSRLLTPTCSYLARSKSAACMSGEEASCHPLNATPSPTIITPKLRHQSVSAHRRPPASSCSNNSQQRNISATQIKTVRQETMKKIPIGGSTKRSAAAVKNSAKPSASSQSRTASASPKRSPRRSISRHSTPMHVELPAVPEEDAAVCGLSLSAGNRRPVSAPDKGQQTLRRENLPETPRSKLPETQRVGSTRDAVDGTPQSSEVMTRPSAGTTDPKEASRLLAEKRREARMQREKEEQERLLKEEADRWNREEQHRLRAEEQARQAAEARRLVEEKRRQEEEEQRRAEEERAQAMREAALLQKQREEESAKERARAEQMKQEREIAAQKEEAERQARKKRLEEIMRRTRRTDSPDTKSVSARSPPKENTEPPHNGTIEDTAKTPVGTKTAQLDSGNEDDVVPVVAFKERRSLRALSGLEEIQTKQRAEVI